jgi:hypothetical protein
MITTMPVHAIRGIVRDPTGDRLRGANRVSLHQDLKSHERLFFGNVHLVQGEFVLAMWSR